MIQINNLHKAYGRNKVLSDINLVFEAGQSVALIGPNGSGKTTLIKIILGLVLSNEGKVKVLGKNIATAPQYRQDIGYMPQINRFPVQMKVKFLFRLMERLRAGTSPADLDLELFEQLKIYQYMNKVLGELSVGMKQQVSAALAFYFNPSILILDEPTAALDPLSNELLKTKIRNSSEKRRLILTTSHILNDLDDICNHVVYLMDGKIHFNNSLSALKQRTSEVKLNKMVVTLLEKKQNT